MTENKTSRWCWVAAMIMLPSALLAGDRPVAAAAVTDWNATIHGCHSPESLSCTMKSRVRYSAETRIWGSYEEMPSGVEVWERRSGDCRSFAICMLDLCAAKGINAKIYIFTSPSAGKAHAVVIGEWLGQKWMSSNGVYSPVRSLADASGQVAREQGWSHADTTCACVSKSRQELTRGIIAGKGI